MTAVRQKLAAAKVRAVVCAGRVRAFFHPCFPVNDVDLALEALLG